MTEKGKLTSLLNNFHIVTLANNLPGPLAVAQLRNLGASVTKIEPLGGDPLSVYSREWYDELSKNQKIIRLNLKEESDKKHLYELLEKADMLVTSMRRTSLERLGLDNSQTRKKFPNLLQIDIIGYPPPADDVPGHDLTYQAKFGLLTPPALPRVLLADLAAAEKVVNTALALILAKEKNIESGNHAQISITESLKNFCAPFGYGLTKSEGILGGNDCSYNLYETEKGWIAVGALEPHFREKLLSELGIKTASYENLQNAFSKRNAEEWEEWASERGIPIIALTET